MIAETPSEKLHHKSWQTPKVCLLIMAAAAPFSFAIWMALLNNFSIEVASFTGREIGILQSVREVPGFLAFTAVFLLLLMREQVFAVLSLALLGLGITLTGFFPTEYGLYFTTLIMSIGFHYFETVQMSLSLQWFSQELAPRMMGLQLSAKSISSIVAYALLWIALDQFAVGYVWLYVMGGSVTILAALFIWLAFPKIEGHSPQRKTMVLRRRYWLFYALTFMGGARRQIFVVFAGFLLVEKFGFSASMIAGLYLANHIITSIFSPMLGSIISRFGERSVLVFEYVGLIIVFGGYAYVESSAVASVLYVVDHVFFAFAIAQKSYLQKIADGRDIAATSSVSFSINHIAAVIIPWVFGAFLWLKSPSYVFLAGAGMAAVSLVLSFNIPRKPAPGNEVLVGKIPHVVPAE